MEIEAGEPTRRYQRKLLALLSVATFFDGYDSFVLALVLPLSLWYCGAPLAVAVAGVFAYRVLALWLPMPVALAFLPTLRTMGERQVSQVPPPVPRSGGLTCGCALCTGHVC